MNIILDREAFMLWYDKIKKVNKEYECITTINDDNNSIEIIWKCRYCDKYTNYGEYVKINSFKLIVQMKKMQEEIDELKSRKN